LNPIFAEKTINLWADLSSFSVVKYIFDSPILLYHTVDLNILKPYSHYCNYRQRTYPFWAQAIRSLQDLFEFVEGRNGAAAPWVCSWRAMKVWPLGVEPI
jgi:hypothetical protein